MISRLISSIAFSNEFGRQMRFVTGPRQTGKTTIAKQFLKKCGCETLYYNWDNRKTRDNYLRDNHFFSNDIYNTKSLSEKRWICMDEIHKYPDWKNVLKDFFDSFCDENGFIVTGSARLDLFRKSGDSLAGRYFLFHLNPLTLREVIGLKKDLEPPDSAEKLIHYSLDNNKYFEDETYQLLEFSGFPEPYQSDSKRFCNKWRADYIDRIIKEDFREITQAKDLEKIAILMHLLPSKIGSLLSINSLTSDMKCSFQTVANYLNLIDLGYLAFRLKSYTKKINRAIHKEAKLYFYDWTRAGNHDTQFENYIAVQLKSIVDMWTDWGTGSFELRFIRTRDGKETDFVILRDGNPYLLCEVKTSRSKIEYHHLKNIDTLGGDVPFVQIVKQTGIAEKIDKHIYQISASRFLSFGW